MLFRPTPSSRIKLALVALVAMGHVLSITLILQACHKKYTPNFPLTRKDVSVPVDRLLMGYIFMPLWFAFKNRDQINLLWMRLYLSKDLRDANGIHTSAEKTVVAWSHRQLFPIMLVWTNSFLFINCYRQPIYSMLSQVFLTGASL